MRTLLVENEIVILGEIWNVAENKLFLTFNAGNKNLFYLTKNHNKWTNLNLIGLIWFDLYFKSHSNQIIYFFLFRFGCILASKPNQFASRTPLSEGA